MQAARYAHRSPVGHRPGEGAMVENLGGKGIAQTMRSVSRTLSARTGPRPRVGVRWQGG